MEVFKDIYGQILQTKKIFARHFSKQCIDDLALVMQESEFSEQHVIC